MDLRNDSHHKAPKGRAKNYLKAVKEELRKITWPAKDELVFFTKVVIGATFIFGLGIFVVDLVVKGALDGVRVLANLIFG